MITEIAGLHADVIGFEFTGEVTKKELDAIIAPAVKSVGNKQDRISMVLVLRNDSKFTAGALFDEAWIALKNITKWRKVAIVSDEEKVRNATHAMDNTLLGEYKYFPLAEEREALQWAEAASIS